MLGGVFRSSLSLVPKQSVFQLNFATWLLTFHTNDFYIERPHGSGFTCFPCHAFRQSSSVSYVLCMRLSSLWVSVHMQYTWSIIPK